MELAIDKIIELVSISLCLVAPFIFMFGLIDANRRLKPKPLDEAVEEILGEAKTEDPSAIPFDNTVSGLIADNVKDVLNDPNAPKAKTKKKVAKKVSKTVKKTKTTGKPAKKVAKKRGK